MHITFHAPTLPEGGYYYAVIVLKPYKKYTRTSPPPCATSSDMQRTDYGYPQPGGEVALALTPAKSHTRHWCPGGDYLGAIYAVPHAPPCESAYPCRSEPYKKPCAGIGPGCVEGVVARPREWAYPQGLPTPLASGTTIVGHFTVTFPSTLKSRAAPRTRTTPRAARPVLSHKRLLHIALRVARSYGARHPKDIVEATGRHAIADRVFDEPEPRSPEAPQLPIIQKAQTELTSEEGGPNRLVDLLAMRGHFVKRARPHGFPGAEGRVLTLIVDAHTGVVYARGLVEKTPDLSQLGHVTRLR